MDVAPSLAPLSDSVQCVADGGKHAVGQRRPDQRHAEGNSVGAEPGRHGQRRKIHQVDEIGVDAEPGVERDGIGEHLGDGVGRGRRSAAAAVDLRPFSPRGADQLGKLVEGLKVSAALFCLRAEDDAAHDRVDRLRVSRDKIADGDERSATQGPA